MPFFGQEILEMAQKKGPLTDPGVPAGAGAALRTLRADARDRCGHDPPPPRRARRPDRRTSVADRPDQRRSLLRRSSTRPAAVAGYPHITVPGGYVFGLPVGISFIGRAWSEPTLFKLAYAFEQATKQRKAPTFAATADLA